MCVSQVYNNIDASYMEMPVYSATFQILKYSKCMTAFSKAARQNPEQRAWVWGYWDPSGADWCNLCFSFQNASMHRNIQSCDSLVHIFLKHQQVGVWRWDAGTAWSSFYITKTHRHVHTAGKQIVPQQSQETVLSSGTSGFSISLSACYNWIEMHMSLFGYTMHDIVPLPILKCVLVSSYRWWDVISEFVNWDNKRWFYCPRKWLGTR